NIERPTMMVFDLDPGAPANIVQCCQVGLWLRDLLGQMKLRSFAKTSGSKGLQVYVPLNTALAYDQTKNLSLALAQYLEHEHADLVTSNMSKAVRKGKVFVDWSQNDEHKTTICVYSLRAREEPTVSHKKLEGDSATYQLLNISGSLLLAANTIFYGSYPSTFVNLIWAAIAVFSIAARRRVSSRYVDMK